MALLVVQQIPLLSVLLLVLLNVVLSRHSQRTPLTDRILHYDTLSYDAQWVRSSHDRIRRSTPARGSSPNHLDKHVLISFYALGSNFTLDLWPSTDVFSPTAQITVHSSNGSIVPSSYDKSTFYRGRIVGDPRSKIHGHIKTNGVFDGEIITGQRERYHIEMADKYFKEKQEFHSVIYSVKDVLFNVEGKPSGCGAKNKLLAELELLQATAKPIKKSPSRNSYLKRDTPTGTLSSHFKKKRHIEKRTKTVSGGRYCPIFIAADHFFVSDIGGGNDEASIAEIASIFASVQEIYNRADFDEDGAADNIVPILVKTELFTTSSHNGLFGDSNIEVSDYLNRWSQIDHSDFCLALLLTYRDFADGILGLAWVAQPPGGSRGGICEDRSSLSIGSRSLNTAIVTYLNYGSRQPRAVVSITIAHEFGHNFGSSHDPEGNAECSPGGSRGNFIMYSRATDGDQPNNDEFSPCSSAAIEQILNTKTDCFTDTAAFCGNQIVEDGEECDCGSSDDEECAAVDPCCEPGSCMLRSTAKCSAQDRCCVSTTCLYQVAGTECQVETECGEQAVCSGSSSLCPEQVTKNSTCNNGTRFCQNAECTGSVCLTLSPQRADCQCTEEESEQCHVCCMIGDTCTSTFTLADEGVLKTGGQYRESGRSCNDYTGYCSDDSVPVCIGVDNERTLNDLEDLFSLDTLNSVLRWLRTYWWVPILVVVAIVILILLLHFTYRKRKPIKKVARRASLSVRRQSSSGNDPANSAAAARERVKKQNREKIQSLKKFFPSCDSETIVSVLRTCKTEERAVRQLVTIGFPMKKLPMPRV